MAPPDDDRILFAEPKSIFEFFQNEYYASPACDGLARAEGQMQCLRAWRTYRAADPTILATKDEGRIRTWVRTGSLPAEVEEPTPVEEASAGDESCGEGEGEDEDAEEDEEEEEEEDEGEPGAVTEDRTCCEAEDVDEEVHAPIRTRARDSGAAGAGADEGNVASWTPAQVRDFVLLLAKRKGGKSEERLRAIAGCLFTKDVDGALLLAAKADVVVETTTGVLKWEKSLMKREGNLISKTLAEKQAAAKACEGESYFARSRQLAAYYKCSPAHIREAMETALTPVPRGALAEAVRFTTVCTRDSSDGCCAVDAVNEDVSKRNTTGGSGVAPLFKVVSVTTPDDPREVWHNMIYFSREGWWVLLASVDFATHGSAQPGHWHLNRAPLGEFVPHWGRRGDGTFHGEPDSCPVWWQLIPEGFTYKHTPARAGFSE